MNNIIKALNLTEGAVLTLEKMDDRMEFEAMAVMAGLGDLQNNGEKGICGFKDTCEVCSDCPSLCEVCLTNCTTKGQYCPGKAQP